MTSEQPDTLRDMETATSTKLAPLGTCHACNGTGIDAVFGGECSECLRDAENAHLLEARFGAARGRGDQVHTPGERIDGRSFGQGRGQGASDKALAFMESLIAEARRHRNLPDEVLDKVVSDEPLTGKRVSVIIDAMKTLNKNMAEDRAKQGGSSSRGDRSNRHPGRCVDCGQTVEADAGVLFKTDGKWTVAHLDGKCPSPIEIEVEIEGIDLSPLEAFASRGIVRFGVPNSDTRLKVQVKFARNGTIYVDDAAAYGYGAKYGQQRQGQGYRGDIIEELTAILDDPHAAVIRYAELTSRCGVCNAPLEDAASINRGMGPICATKFG